MARNAESPAKSPQAAASIGRDLVRSAGLEPVTPGLEGRCSIRLSYDRQAFLSKGAEKWWSRRWDLNSRPPEPESGALTGLRYASTNEARILVRGFGLVKQSGNDLPAKRKKRQGATKTPKKPALSKSEKKRRNGVFEKLVEAAGFELATLCSQSRCATGLRYASKRSRRFASSRRPRNADYTAFF